MKKALLMLLVYQPLIGLFIATALVAWWSAGACDVSCISLEMEHAFSSMKAWLLRGLPGN